MTTSFQSCAAGFMTPELAATPACATKDIAVVPESSQAAGACSASAGSASPAAKLHFCKEGRDMVPSIRLEHFQQGRDAKIVYRDGALLGNHPSIVLPSSLASAPVIRLAIHLNHKEATGDAGLVHAPTFAKRHLNDVSKLMGANKPLAQNELLVRPSDIGASMTVSFKKKMWPLSKLNSHLCQVKWPKYVLSATAMIDGKKLCVISQEFEVRSKEQGHKTRAARGLSAKVCKRRTPETEIREKNLRSIHANIITLRDQKQTVQLENTEFQTRFEFICAVARSSSSDPVATKILQLCKAQQALMEKWNS